MRHCKACLCACVLEKPLNSIALDLHWFFPGNELAAMARLICRALEDANLTRASWIEARAISVVTIVHFSKVQPKVRG